MRHERDSRIAAGAVTAFLLAMLYIALFVIWGFGPKPQCKSAPQDAPAQVPWRSQ